MSEWTKWKGGEQPRETMGKKVDLRFRSGQEATNQDPQEWLWEHYARGSGLGHITAYKLTTIN